MLLDVKVQVRNELLLVCSVEIFHKLQTTVSIPAQTVPPHYKFVQLKPTNLLKQAHYLVDDDALPTKKMIHTQFS